MSETDAIFGAKLYEDEFSPKDGSLNSFWKIPKQIAAIDNKLLSNGAKMLYGVLVGLCYGRNTAWASKDVLQKKLGGPSKKTLYLWQRELIDARLIRVHQKGRGLPNNYYLLRSPILGNMKPGQSEMMQVYKDPITGAQYLKPHKECMREFIMTADEWFEQQRTVRTPFPKPNWRYNRRNYKEIKQIYEDSVKYQIDGQLTPEEEEKEVKVIADDSINLLSAHKEIMEELATITNGT